MNRIEREELLRRYLEGEMNLQQEHDFFIQVALDKELRHELKAHQTIESALRKDRVVDNASYSTIQTGVTAMLASLPPLSDIREPQSRMNRFGRTSRILLTTLALLLLVGIPTSILLMRESDRRDSPQPSESIQHNAPNTSFSWSPSVQTPSTRESMDEPENQPGTERNLVETTFRQSLQSARRRTSPPSYSSSKENSPNLPSTARERKEESTIPNPPLPPAETPSVPDLSLLHTTSVDSANSFSTPENIPSSATEDSLDVKAKLRWRNNFPEN